MPIIYTYPSATPTTSDLLLFSDVSVTDPKNATRKCTIDDIVTLVGALVPGGGTVTSITGANSKFINHGIAPNPITTTGTITSTLSATGTDDATTFLRGDNTWAVPVDTNTTYSAGNGLVEAVATVFSADLYANGGLVFAGADNELRVDLGATNMDNELLIPDGGTGVGTGNPDAKTSFTGNSVIIMDGSKTYLEDTGAMSNGNLVIGKTAAAPQLGAITSTGGTITVSYNDPNINLEVGGVAAGVSSFTNSNGVFVSASTTNAVATGAVTMGTIDLSATGTPNANNFLRGDNTWSSVTADSGFDIINFAQGEDYSIVTSIMYFYQVVSPGTFTASKIKTYNTVAGGSSTFAVAIYSGLLSNPAGATKLGDGTANPTADGITLFNLSPVSAGDLDLTKGQNLIMGFYQSAGDKYLGLTSRVADANIAAGSVSGLPFPTALSDLGDSLSTNTFRPCCVIY